MQTPHDYHVDVKETLNWIPGACDFANYDVVFNVAGIAHIKETKKNEHLYYEVNRDLAISIAEEAKAAGVRKFIQMSTMSVYGLNEGHITKQTAVDPKNAYGRSKAEADDAIMKLADDSFIFTCLRPPMVYGKDCKGNYQRLRTLALKSPIFPRYDNERSMIYIENLCEFVKRCIDSERDGLFFPQNEQYVNTSEMVELIASEHGKRVRLTRAFNWAISKLPVSTSRKMFGSLTYEKTDTVGKYGFEESIKRTEADA